MTKHVDHPFSATLSTLDLALVGCLQALAAFSEQASHDYRPSAEERDWRAAGQKLTFRFSTALNRDLFKNDVRRLLPAHLVRFHPEDDNDPAAPYEFRPAIRRITSL
jgi:hypothetical protein